MPSSTHLALPFIEAAQSQKHVTHNEAVRRLDAIAHLSIIDRDLAVPPVSPAEGDRYIPASVATGAWASHEDEIAAWLDGAWEFFSPQEGWLAWPRDEDKLFIYDGSAWVDFFSAIDLAGGDLKLLGINGAADTTNRLTVSTPSVLLNRETDDINVTLNKEAAADDARLTFQTGFSTRALFGLLADDDFTIKVTPDGSTFNTALIADKDDGMVSMPQHSKFSATSNFDNFIGSGAWTKVNFNSANHNDQNDFDAGNARFTAPADGFYTFGTLINFKENNAVPTFIAIRLTVGGVAVANTEQRYTGTIVTLETSLNTHAMLKLNKNDNVEVEVFFATDDGFVEANTCGFWGHKVP